MAMMPCLMYMIVQAMSRFPINLHYVQLYHMTVMSSKTNTCKSNKDIDNEV